MYMSYFILSCLFFIEKRKKTNANSFEQFLLNLFYIFFYEKKFRLFESHKFINSDILKVIQISRLKKY